MKKTFAKYIAIVMALCMLFLLAACAAKTEPASAGSATSETPKADTTTPNTATAESEYYPAYPSTVIAYTRTTDIPVEWNDPEAMFEGDVITEREGVVYLMENDSSISRFSSFDIPRLEQWMGVYAPNVTVRVLDAAGDGPTQLKQAETVISDNALGVIFYAADSYSSSGCLQAFAEAGIPVVNVAADAYGGPVLCYVNQQFKDIGTEHAKQMEEYMKANPKDGPYKIAWISIPLGYAFPSQIKEGIDEYVAKWEADGLAEITYFGECESNYTADTNKLLEQCLTANNNDIDMVLVNNDDMAGGALAALLAQNMTDTPIFGGFDATLEGVARVIAGVQYSTITAPYTYLTSVSTQVLCWALEGVTIDELPGGIVNATFFNDYDPAGYAQISTPTVTVTADNYKDTIIAQGLYTQAEIDAAVAQINAAIGK